MSHTNLKDSFPEADIDIWYESLQDIFGDWSARYWEQRAILARRESSSDVSLLAKAESFALRAANLVPDSYSYTTLGTVLLEKAAHAQVDVSTYYRRAKEAFDLASTLEGSNTNLVTSMAFLRFSLPVLSRLYVHPGNENAEEITLMETIREHWSLSYSKLAILRDSAERIDNELTSLRRSYESIVSQDG